MVRWLKLIVVTLEHFQKMFQGSIILLRPSYMAVCTSGLKIEVLIIVNEKLANRTQCLFYCDFLWLSRTTECSLLFMTRKFKQFCWVLKNHVAYPECSTKLPFIRGTSSLLFSCFSVFSSPSFCLSLLALWNSQCMWQWENKKQQMIKQMNFKVLKSADAVSAEKTI